MKNDKFKFLEQELSNINEIPEGVMKKLPLSILEEISGGGKDNCHNKSSTGVGCTTKPLGCGFKNKHKNTCGK